MCACVPPSESTSVVPMFPHVFFRPLLLGASSSAPHAYFRYPSHACCMAAFTSFARSSPSLSLSSFISCVTFCCCFCFSTNGVARAGDRTQATNTQVKRMARRRLTQGGEVNVITGEVKVCAMCSRHVEHLSTKHAFHLHTDTRTIPLAMTRLDGSRMQRLWCSSHTLLCLPLFTYSSKVCYFESGPGANSVQRYGIPLNRFS